LSVINKCLILQTKKSILFISLMFAEQVYHFIADYQFVARALVRAAFFAAAERLRVPFVLAAFFAAAERSEALRPAAAELACRERALWEAAAVPSRFNARTLARERVLETGSCL
jgi:hypothetical protein